MNLELDTLTPLEEEIAKRIIEGQSTKEIAHNFGISQQSVRHHLSAIYAKLHVKNRLGMVELLTSGRAE